MDEAKILETIGSAGGMGAILFVIAFRFLGRLERQVERFLDGARVRHEQFLEDVRGIRRALERGQDVED